MEGEEDEHAAAALIQARMRSMKAKRQVTRMQTTMSLTDKVKYGAGGAREVLDLFIDPDVGIDLKAKYPDAASASAEHLAGQYEVIGPPRIVNALRRGLGQSASLSGVLSPCNEVTLPPAVKRDAGIPMASTHFAFVYPLKKLNMHSLNISEEPWAFALLLGGFAYFDENGKLLGVNSLTIVPSPAVLHLVGPYPPRQKAMVALARWGRVSPVPVECLRDAGFRRFGWVHPGELVNGGQMSDRNECAHGGFVYEMAGGNQALFVLTPTLDKHGSFDSDGRFGHAYVGLRQALVEAVENREAIEAGKSGRRQFIKDTVKLAVALTFYFGIACAFYVPYMGWTLVQTIYFASATASTAGYGDIYPTRDWEPRLFTVLLIFLGVFIVGSTLTTFIMRLTSSYEAWAARHVTKLFKTRSVDDEGHAVAERASIYYLKFLFPLILLNILFQLIFAGIFTQVQGMDYFAALYHCIVTATTVGYGDELIDQENAQLVAIFHILISTALLGNTISSIDTLRQERKKELQVVKALNQKLNKTLLQRVELHASALRPEVARDAAGMTELEFVVCMAIELGMVDLKQLHPFVKQFRALDILGNGRVGMEDLNAAEALKRQMGMDGNLVSAADSDTPKLATLADFLSGRMKTQKKTKGNLLNLEARKAGAPMSAAERSWGNMAEQVGSGNVRRLGLSRVMTKGSKMKRMNSKMKVINALGSSTRGRSSSSGGAWSSVIPAPRESKAVIVGGGGAWSGNAARAPLLLARMGASLGERTKVDPDGSSCNSTSFRRAEPAATEVLPFDTEVDSTRDEDDIEEARRARTDVAEAAPQPVSEV